MIIKCLYVVNKNDPPFGVSWRKWMDAVFLGADFYDVMETGFTILWTETGTKPGIQMKICPTNR